MCCGSCDAENVTTKAKVAGIAVNKQPVATGFGMELAPTRLATSDWKVMVLREGLWDSSSLRMLEASVSNI